MALLAINGFDNLASSPHPDLITQPGWSAVGTVFSSAKLAGLLGGFGLQYPSVSSFVLTYNPGIISTTLIVGFKSRWPGPPASNSLMQFNDSAGGIQCGVSINASNQLYVWRGTTATILATGTKVLAGLTWYGIEVKVNFSNTGSITVMIDGVQDIFTGTVDTTQTANQNGQSIAWSNPVNSWAFDDFYMCNDVGGAPFNDFLGPCHVETVYPNSNNSVQWSPLASTNVSQVSEIANDGDTSYNSTSTSGAVDTFNHAAISGTPVTVLACGIFTSVRKDDVGAQTSNNVLVSGATTANGAAFAPTTSYSWMVDLYTADPNTGAAWTVANLNATKIGYKHV